MLSIRLFVCRKLTFIKVDFKAKIRVKTYIKLLVIPRKLNSVVNMILPSKVNENSSKHPSMFVQKFNL